MVFKELNLNFNEPIGFVVRLLGGIISEFTHEVALHRSNALPRFAEASNLTSGKELLKWKTAPFSHTTSADSMHSMHSMEH